MLVQDWMSRSVITVEEDCSLNKAAQIFQTRVISMLPVLACGKLAGIITDGDLKKALPSKATTLDRYEIISLLDTVTVKKVMASPVKTIGPLYTVDEAAALMLSSSISGMPVCSPSGKIKGIITKSDIFRCFASFTGVAKNGQVFAFTLKDKPGLIKSITDVIRQYGGRLCSIMTSYDDIDDAYRKVFFNVFDIRPERFEELIKEFCTTGNLFYAADLSSGFRKNY